MKIVVFGLGGVGGVVAERLVCGTHEVTAIARGAHLQAMKDQGGLKVLHVDGSETFVPLTACAADEFQGAPDVVLVCLKDYSLESIYPFLERVATPDTTVIPLSNVYGTGERIAKHLEKTMGEKAPLTTCGCIYCSGTIQEPGVMFRNSDLCRILFGMPDQHDQADNLFRQVDIAKELSVGGIDAKCTDTIREDHLRKFSYMASASAAGLIFGCDSDSLNAIPMVNIAFQDAIKEIVRVAAAQNIALGRDVLDDNLRILANAAPGSTTSLQRDLAAGRPSEIEGIIRSVVAWGVAYGVPTPVFARASVAAKEQYGV